MQTDSWIGSLLWGRVGAAVLTLLAVVLGSFGVEFGQEDQQSVFTTIAGLLASVGAVMAILSKWKEQYKSKVEGEQKAVLKAYVERHKINQSGFADIMVLIVVFGIMMIASGCSTVRLTTPDGLAVEKSTLFKTETIGNFSMTAQDGQLQKISLKGYDSATETESFALIQAINQAILDFMAARSAPQ